MATFTQVPASLQRIDQIRLSCNAASNFVKAYYNALSTPSTTAETIMSFYAPTDDHTNVMKSLFTFKHIWYNGNEFLSPADFAKAVKDYLTPARYEVDSFDCQPLNVDLNPTRDLVKDPMRGGGMSILLSVSGSSRIGPIKESESIDFSETIVLVPNLNHEMTKRDRKPTQEWVIASQIFRNV